MTFDKWHNPLAYYTQLNATPTPTNKDGKEVWRNGEIKWGSDNGKMAITKGESFDAAAYLGKEPSSVTVDGVSVRYEIVDDQLIIFKDNPDYYYYPQNAQQGTVNYYVGLTAQATTTVYGAYMLGRTASKIPGVNKLFDKAGKTFNSSRAGTVIASVGGYALQEKIPYWGYITGTPVPTSGTKEVLLYLSKDPDDWRDSKPLLFTLKPDGSHSISKRKDE
ncbi:hypothetical protein PQ478_21700 (plasmid) [Alkalihalophilus pseudofirmus]|uniref:hypothetical protein n=1 Tax=Alkalihalophilus pseudofirmus TaxID=79885 RepID=UPI00259BA2E5|nr:hypothetical protein [Alkalihalophilus pseudofirmus]WEG19173.1 hypothetical protein PQ478_21700 [Alkalihalophilus pseudofirmus]